MLAYPAGMQYLKMALELFVLKQFQCHFFHILTKQPTCNIIITHEITILKARGQQMNSSLNLIPIIMPILAAVIFLVIAVLLIMVFYKSKKAQSLNIQSFEKLAQELKADNQMMKSELETIKETLNSINRMMKEIE